MNAAVILNFVHVMMAIAPLARMAELVTAAPLTPDAIAVTIAAGAGLATAAAKSGLAVTALSQWCLESDQTGLLLSFTNIASQDARDLATRLKRAIEPCF